MTANAQTPDPIEEHPETGSHDTDAASIPPEPVQTEAAQAKEGSTGLEQLQAAVAEGSAAEGPDAAENSATAQQATADPAETEPIAPAAPAAAPRRGGLGAVAAVAIAALVGGAAGSGMTLLLSNTGDATRIASGTQTNGTITITNPESVGQIAAVAAKASPSVVTISVQGTREGGSGSGVVLSADGYIVTNNHVVTLDGQRSLPTIRVTTSDGRIYPAELVGTDPILDLAVVKVDAAANLTPIQFADSDRVNVGDLAVAIGAPLGLEGTVTYGIISNLERSITVASPSEATPEEDTNSEPEESPFDFWRDLGDIFGEDDGDEGSEPGDEQGDEGEERRAPQFTQSTVSLPVLQTDAAINPGNSGGALVDSEGRLIGINVAIASTASERSTAGSIGVGFAIPSKLVQRVTGELIASGTASHGLLGAMIYDSTRDADAAVLGATIDAVTPGGAADAAGIRKGDVIVGFAGKSVRGATDLTAHVRSLPAGSDAELVYVRDGSTYSVTVGLGTL